MATCIDSRASAAPVVCPLPPGDVFTPAELAKAWKLSEQSIRRLFQDLPNVFKLSSTARGKRSYQTLRIPAAIAERVFMERSR